MQCVYYTKGDGMNVVNNMNSVIIEGNLTRDVAVREPKEGFRIARFPIAVDRLYRGADGRIKEEVSFFDVDAHGQRVDYCKEHGTKGAFVRVVGRLRQDRWEDKNGGYHSKVLIIAEHVEFKPVKDNKKHGWEETVKEHTEAANYASASKAAAMEMAIDEAMQEDAVF